MLASAASTPHGDSYSSSEECDEVGMSEEDVPQSEMQSGLSLLMGCICATRQRHPQPLHSHHAGHQLLDYLQDKREEPQNRLRIVED